jgi:flagellin-specific chaperone FliS
MFHNNVYAAKYNSERLVHNPASLSVILCERAMKALSSWMNLIDQGDNIVVDLVIVQRSIDGLCSIIDVESRESVLNGVEELYKKLRMWTNALMTQKIDHSRAKDLLLILTQIRDLWKEMDIYYISKSIESVQCGDRL